MKKYSFFTIQECFDPLIAYFIISNLFVISIKLIESTAYSSNEIIYLVSLLPRLLLFNSKVIFVLIVLFLFSVAVSIIRYIKTKKTEVTYYNSTSLFKGISLILILMMTTVLGLFSFATTYPELVMEYVNQTKFMTWIIYIYIFEILILPIITFIFSKIRGLKRCQKHN